MGNLQGMGWGNDNFKYYFKIQAVKSKYINSIKTKKIHKRKNNKIKA